MTWVAKKSDWAQGKADGLWEQARKLETTTPKNGNYAQRREAVANLRKVAGEFSALARRLRAREEAAAA